MTQKSVPLTVSSPNPDNFGAGYAGLNLLAEFQPDIIKNDMELVRNINDSKPKQAIVEAIVHLCRQLNMKALAEGIEDPSGAGFFGRQWGHADAGLSVLQTRVQAIGQIANHAWL